MVNLAKHYSVWEGKGGEGRERCISIGICQSKTCWNFKWRGKKGQGERKSGEEGRRLRRRRRKKRGNFV